MAKFPVLFVALMMIGVLPVWTQIIPSPSHFESSNGSLPLTELIIKRTDLSEDEQEVFRTYLQTLTNLPLVITDSEEGVNLEFYPLKEELNKKPGTYSLEADASGIRIGFSDEASKQYALISLAQMIRAEQENYTVPFFKVLDAPAFSWRGLHLDVSRHFFTVDEVKRYIDLLAFYKYNVFHWHLTDDQGWRIEIKKYPRLTEIGAFRDSTIVGHYNAQPRTWEYQHYGGFYTQDEIREVVRYANERHVTVVPEIEMPGHSRAALAAYPELSCTGMLQPVPGLWGVFEDIYCSKEESIVFMQDVLDEVMDLFPSEYIHIGGDEAPKTRWENCATCKQVMQDHQLSSAHELQSYFIRRMDAYITAKGKKLIGWDEILEGGLSPNAAVMSWRGEEGGIQAALQNHYVVMSPTSRCYFDYYQSGHASEPLAIGGYLPLEKVYDFNPIPRELPADKRSFILGGQANLWTEYISDFKQVEYMVYPRALAMSQNLWSEHKPDYESFLEVFRTWQEPILEKFEVNYARSIYLPKVVIEREKEGINIRLKGLDATQRFDVFTKEKGGMTFNGGLVMTATDSLYFERTQPGQAQRSLSISVTGEEFNSTVSQQFTIHNALGLPVTLITQPHEKYSHGGSLTLVDGVRGNRPWKGDQWLGFNEQKVVWSIELPDTRVVETATVGFLDAKGSWIYLPETIDVYCSKNGKRWKKIADTKVTSEDQSIQLNCKTRFVRFETNALSAIPKGAEGAGQIPWTFIDEVILNFAE